MGVCLMDGYLVGVYLTGCITFAAENAESSLGISDRKNQYAIPLQEDYITALCNHFCACQLSQHNLAVHSAFLHSLQPVLACTGHAFWMWACLDRFLRASVQHGDIEKQHNQFEMEAEILEMGLVRLAEEAPREALLGLGEEH
jgi:hypothetical protein